MSHELRTPLNAILGFSELLLDAESKRQPERARRYLGNIRKSGQHLLVMVSEILDLSKIEAGRMELDCSALRLADVVDPTISMLEPQATAKNIRLSVSIDEDLDLIADPVRLQQVLLNLLSNAVKFTPEGGEVSLSATADDSEVCITVKDTGSGIAKEDQARIFEKFEQAVNGRDKTAEGTGLGLALTKSLVELHGGAISLESERGAGATFRVRLPRNGVAETAA
jgi:signal transduction histidine kinase